MLLLPIITQLKTIETAGAAEFKKVAGAANFASAREDIKICPAAYVIPLRDVGSPNPLEGGAVSQHIKEQFGVILAVSNLRDAKGEAAQAELERLRKLVIASLLGFSAADYDPIEYVGGTILAIDAAVLWWQITFTTGYYERNY